MLIYAIPFISAAIGWFTNYVAIKMLFYPREPKNILGVTIQGIFPKRKKTLADRLGKVVKRDLFSMDVIQKKIDNENTRAQVKESILNEFEIFLTQKLKEQNPMLAMLLSEKMLTQILEKVSDHLDQAVPRLMHGFSEKLNDIDVEALVREKVENFSHEKLENLLMSVIQKELKFIELVGAILGFIIGLVQIGLVHLQSFLM